MLISNDLHKLFRVLPHSIRNSLENHPNQNNLVEVIMDLGRRPEARFFDYPEYISPRIVSWQDLEYSIQKVGNFSGDNRAGIETTLHRISAIKNRKGNIIGLTCRVGRAVLGTMSIARDLLESRRSILLLGKPGIGKTTAIREMSRILADELYRRVIIIDTSNEIAGDGDVCHSAIGKARRMQVSHPDLQHQVMIEAVENHMPEVIIVDEIGTELEALAARTIAERGVQLVGTAHGHYLDSLIKNPTLADLVGGIQYVTLGDEEAKRRNTQKSIIERKGPATFNIAVEMQKRDNWLVHEAVEHSVDRILDGQLLYLQNRYTTPEGKIHIKHIEFSEEFTHTISLQQKSLTQPNDLVQPKQDLSSEENSSKSLPKHSKDSRIYVYPYAISYQQIQKAIEVLNLPVEITRDIHRCNHILTLKAQIKRGNKLITIANEKRINIQTIQNTTTPQIIRALRHLFKSDFHRSHQAANDDNLLNALFIGSNNDQIEAIEETKLAIKNIVIPKRQTVELLPRKASIRKVQHELVSKYQMKARSFGKEPYRKLRIYT
uniref:R3H domain-containing protein n=1 Tax=Gronococcus sybilensis TaxID=3028029 RepID=A0A9Y1I2R6_9RHOD|nr:hypothetical protein GRSY_172 [Gronococcus sybilensis]